MDRRTLVLMPDRSLCSIQFFQDKYAEGGSGGLPILFCLLIMQDVHDVTHWSPPTQCKEPLILSFKQTKSIQSYYTQKVKLIWWLNSSNVTSFAFCNLIQGEWGDTTQATVLPRATRVKVKSSSQGEILELVKWSSQESVEMVKGSPSA